MGKVAAEIFVPMPEVVFEFIAVIFEGIEGFIFNLPTRTSGFNYLPGAGLIKSQAF